MTSSVADGAEVFLLMCFRLIICIKTQELCIESTISHGVDSILASF